MSPLDMNSGFLQSEQRGMCKAGGSAGHAHAAGGNPLFFILLIDSTEECRGCEP